MFIFIPRPQPHPLVQQHQQQQMQSGQSPLLQQHLSSMQVSATAATDAEWAESPAATASK